VSIHRLKVGTRHLELLNSAAELNREFDFSGEFESPYPLRNVFVVLDMSTDDAGNALFVREVGNLQPHEPRQIDLKLALNQKLGPGHYQVHVFTDGAEVFHSEMPFALMEQSLDAMIRRRIEGVEDAPPKPFIGPLPEYPAKLLHDKVSGSATIHFTINPNGRVIDPTIKTASLPEFGDAALVAARQWRFMPKVAQGRPVKTVVDMPFAFVPPGTKPPPDSP
jgi:TonB family protein